MSLAAADSIVETSPLALRAADNLRRNAEALGRSIALPPLTFRLARDGFLTAYDAGWLAGNSVPRRSAEVMLRNTAIEGNVACLVLPVHAGQVAACLDKVGPYVSVIALLASEDVLPPLLACADFSAEITAGRLAFAWDEASLKNVFVEHPGLPIPQQFVRLATSTSETADPAMKMAQAVFAPVLAGQVARIKAAHAVPLDRSTGLCVVGPQRFKLWDDAAAILSEAVGGEMIDTDLPAHSGSAHIAERAAAGRAIVTANLGRADRAELIDLPRPWICWATNHRVPAYVPKHPRDGLLIAGPALAPLAAAAGWPASRVRVARFPTDRLPALGRVMTIITDLPSLDPPKIVCDFSSWRVAWDTIAAELQADPLRLGPDAGAYLDQFLRRHDVADEKFPRDLFLRGVIAAGFAVGVALLLKQRGHPPAIHGNGWADHAAALDVRGPVTTRAALHDALAAAACVVDCSTNAPIHAMASIDRPILRPAGMTLPTLTARLRSIAESKASSTDYPPLSATVIDTLL